MKMSTRPVRIEFRERSGQLEQFSDRGEMLEVSAEDHARYSFATAPSPPEEHDQRQMKHWNGSSGILAIFVA